MKHIIARAALAAALILGSAGAAGAQTSPPPAPPAPPAPAGMPDPARIKREIHLRFAPDGGARALTRAYHAIGEAEALNGRSGFIAQARNHYTGAYARFRRGDASGAAAEATAAAALARAALDERPAYVPRGLEAPPKPAARVLPAEAAQPAGAPPPPGSELSVDIVRRLPPMLGGGVDAESLARLVALENTAEVRALAERANAASAAAQRAGTASDRDEARRQARLAHDLAQAVRDLTRADHPDQMPGRMPRRPLGAPGAPGGPGGLRHIIELSQLDALDALDGLDFGALDDFPMIDLDDLP